MCKACQSIGNVKRSSKTFPITLMDMGAMFAGLVGNFALNGAVAKVTENMNTNTGAMVNQYLPYAKAAVGVAPIFSKKIGRKLPRWAKAAGAGMTIGAGVEIVKDVAPEVIQMAGAGDLYTGLGMTDTLIIDPSGSMSEIGSGYELNGSYADYDESTALYGTEADALYGTGDLADVNV